MSKTEAFIAANRFGLGPRPGELAAIAGDPRGWVAAQIAGERRPPKPLRGLPSAADGILAVIDAQRAGGAEAAKQTIKRLMQERAMQEMALRAEAMATSSAPFRERMVAFWSNHFTVSIRAPQIAPIAAAYEREAIRPHVFGRFEDLLAAVARHPAMLVYLDNATSFGPNSMIGRRRGMGLNENLAREILELHTLGVDGGYRQDDVLALARILTGWSHGALGRRGRRDGEFRFRERGHEPGAKTLLGKTYREDGLREGEAALSDLARHPSTARFIATKLVRHFVADDPPVAAVTRIERVFRDSGGDLAAVSRALVDLPAAWADPLAKVKTPHELVIASMRALSIDRLKPRLLVGSLKELGQIPFRAPSPAGWPDRAADWVAPEALMRRIEWVRAVAARLPDSLEPLAFADRTIAPAAAAGTMRTVGRAPSAEEGVALVLASAEFQRR